MGKKRNSEKIKALKKPNLFIKQFRQNFIDNMKRGKGNGFGKGSGNGKKTERERPKFRIPEGTSDLRLSNKLAFQENAERALNEMGITDPLKHERTRRVFDFLNRLFHDAIDRRINTELRLLVEKGIDPFSEQGRRMIEQNGRSIVRTLVHDQKFGALVESGLRDVLGEDTARFLDEYKRLMDE